MKYKIKVGASVGQDHRFFKWPEENADVEFSMKSTLKGQDNSGGQKIHRCQMVAYGFGQLPPKDRPGPYDPKQYGSGAVFVKFEDLIEVGGERMIGGEENDKMFSKLAEKNGMATSGYCPECKQLIDLSGKETHTCGGVKHDSQKPDWSLLPPDAIEEIVKVYDLGVKKYGRGNWCKGILYSRIFAAVMRHLWAWWRGEEKDPESGLSHCAHAAWGAITLMEYSRRGLKEFDDRGK